MTSGVNPFEGQSVVPVFSNGGWEVDCALGECGDEFTTREIANKTHMVFGFQLSINRKGFTLQGVEILMQNPTKGIVVENDCLIYAVVCP